MYAYIVLLHVIGAFVFALSHGVSVAVGLRLRGVRSREQAAGMLELSGMAIGGMYVGLLLLLVGGIWAGFAGEHWGRLWIWAAIGILVVIIGAMYAVATPFYGYGGQLHRWFEGEELLNGPFNMWQPGIIEAICSFPGCYSLHFMSHDTFAANKAALGAEPYPLLAYPSVDAGNPAITTDPFNPIDQGAKKRYSSFSASGFDKLELAKAKVLADYLASPLPPALAPKFYCIRGITNAYTTLSETTWGFVPPLPPSPITDTYVAAGDTTLPAWTTRHVGILPGHLGDVVGNGAEHRKIMDSTKTFALLAAILSIPYP